jgi:hypothetical protein
MNRVNEAKCKIFYKGPPIFERMFIKKYGSTVGAITKFIF